MYLAKMLCLFAGLPSRERLKALKGILGHWHAHRSVRKELINVATSCFSIRIGLVFHFSFLCSSKRLKKSSRKEFKLSCLCLPENLIIKQ